MKPASTLLNTFALAAIYSAFAQAPGGGIFQRFNKNVDGKVSTENEGQT
jgi:hypothetical protein